MLVLRKSKSLLRHSDRTGWTNFERTYGSRPFTRGQVEWLEATFGLKLPIGGSAVPSLPPPAGTPTAEEPARDPVPSTSGKSGLSQP